MFSKVKGMTFMGPTFQTDNYLPRSAFLNQVGIEIHRAERYRTFLSLVRMDLTATLSRLNGDSEKGLEEVLKTIRQSVRASDQFAFVDESCVAIVLPETARQDAEVTVRRITDSVRSTLMQDTGNGFEHVIPIEMASFPDTAGAQPV
jgi:GGDEF domain-containing protein